MARTPKPTELKRREGNPSKENLDREDAPAVEYVEVDTSREPPEFVTKYPGAREEWDRVTPLLLKMGVFAEADTGVVGRYCVALAIMSKALAELNDDGLTMVHKTGAKQVSTSFTAYMKSSDSCLKLEKELGLTPSARTKVTTWGGNRPPPRATDDADPDGPKKPESDETEEPRGFRLTGS